MRPAKPIRPISLGGLDDNCAAHQFIRVYGRRPTPDELLRCRQTRAAAPHPPGAGHATTVTGAVTGFVRREVSRLIGRR